jgi:hypothetical protein
MYLRPVLTVVGNAKELVAGPLVWFDDSDLMSLNPIPWEPGLDE